MRIGVQPYTFHTLDESTTTTLRRIADARFEAVELGPDANTDEVHDVLAETGLAVSSLSGGMGLRSDLEDYLDASEAFGTRDVVVMWADPDRFESREAVRDLAAELERMADELAERDCRLHYHNHDHEFVDLGDMTGYEVLVEETDALRFELDLGWAGTGGVDPASLLRSIGGRVTHVHVKDMHFGPGEFATFGEGDLDVAGVLDAAREAGVEWALYENDRPADPVAEVSHASLQLDRYTDHVCR